MMFKTCSLPLHNAAYGIFRPVRIIGIPDILENTGSGLSDGRNLFIIDKNSTVTYHHGCTGFLELRITPDINFKPDTFIIWPDLTVENHLTAPQCPTCSQRSAPDTEKT